MVRKRFANFYLVLMFLFLYAPIIVLVFFSFNKSKSMGNWSGFSLKWYVELFNNEKIQSAFFYTITCALISTTVAIILGTITAIGIYKSKKKVKNLILNANYLPVINPDIVTAVSLMILYISIGLQRGFITMVLSHIMFSTPFVILTVLPRLYSMNSNITEAAMDLGATPIQAIRKVIIPEIMPGIIAGALIAFTMSVDDFIISYFNVSNGVTNLSIEIYNEAKRGVKPTVNALATIMVSFVILFVLIANKLSSKKKSKEVSNV